MDVLDLFAGCGGLSLGLEMAGANPRIAIEKSPMAAQTHFRNFHLRGGPWDPAAWDEHLAKKDQPVKQAADGTVVGDITQVIRDTEFMDHLKEVVQPSIVAGGPPCQGFSMAGGRDPEDDRNQLPLAFLRVVEHVTPEGVLIENVLGINRSFRGGCGPTPFEELGRALSVIGPGYAVQPVEVNAKHYGVPQNRPRMMLIAVRADVAARNGLEPEVVAELWRSEDAATALREGRKPRAGALIPPVSFSRAFVTAHDAHLDLPAEGDVVDYLWGLDDDRYHEPRAEFARSMRFDTARHPAVQTLTNQTHRKHGDRVRERFRLYHYLRDQRLPTTIMSIPYKQPLDLAQAELLRALDGRSEPPAGVGRPGEDLMDVVVRLRTKKHSQRALVGAEPAPTVVTLPDDYVHADADRIMTVRELARFQSFPDWFEFMGKETTGSHRRKIEVPQFSQVGNAVPPLLARAVGRTLLEALSKA